MPRRLTATKTSHKNWIHIFSVFIMIIPTRLLCQMQADPSGAEFLSTISKFIKRKKFCHFHVVVVQWQQRNVQKSLMLHVQNRCFPLSASYCFFLLSRLRCLFTIHCDPSEHNFLSANWIAPAGSIQTFFDSSVVPSFLIRKAWWTNRENVAR